MSEQKWFCHKGGQWLGPFSQDQLRQMTAAGLIHTTDPVIRDDNWGGSEVVAPVADVTAPLPTALPQVGDAANSEPPSAKITADAASPTVSAEHSAVRCGN